MLLSHVFYAPRSTCSALTTVTEARPAVDIEDQIGYYKRKKNEKHFAKSRKNSQQGFRTLVRCHFLPAK